MTQATAVDTREAIVMAAFACFRTRGLSRTTVVDIARQADVSRSTVYEYFKDKSSIVEACAEAASQRFYRNMTKAVNRCETLEDQLVRAGVFVTQAKQVVEPEKYFDKDEVSILLTRNAATLLRECSEFFAPYLTAAKLTGEVRKDLDVAMAGEWIARVLFSLFNTPSPYIDMHDDEAVDRFLRAYVIRGLIDYRAMRARRTDAAN